MSSAKRYGCKKSCKGIQHKEVVQHGLGNRCAYPICCFAVDSVLFTQFVFVPRKATWRLLQSPRHWVIIFLFTLQHDVLRHDRRTSWDPEGSFPTKESMAVVVAWARAGAIPPATYNSWSGLGWGRGSLIYGSRVPARLKETFSNLPFIVLQNCGRGSRIHCHAVRIGPSCMRFRLELSLAVRMGLICLLRNNAHPW
jgi:hypothetical protein